MKKYFCIVVGIAFLLSGMVFAVDSATTFRWAYDKGFLDQKSSILNSAHLTREELAPLLLHYISTIAKKDYTEYPCKAKDLSLASPEYRDSLEKLCRYGIIVWKNQQLNPKRALTNAQAVVLVMRIVDGFHKEGGKGQHRAINYFERAKALGFDGIDPIYRKKNRLAKLEDFINFLYSIEYPYQTINNLGGETQKSFRSADEAFLRLTEILRD